VHVDAVLVRIQVRDVVVAGMKACNCKLSY
jgi:hypothetical protein